MEITGKCYCGAVQYKAAGEPGFKMQCHCRECQYFAGGMPNVLIGMPSDGFAYSKGEAKSFTRKDLENAVTREFCPECGTHILTRAPAARGMVFLKVGTLDDPAQYGKPEMAIFTCDKQAFHTIPEGMAAFDKIPG